MKLKNLEELAEEKGIDLNVLDTQIAVFGRGLGKVMGGNFEMPKYWEPNGKFAERLRLVEGNIKKIMQRTCFKIPENYRWLCVTVDERGSSARVIFEHKTILVDEEVVKFDNSSPNYRKFARNNTEDVFEDITETWVEGIIAHEKAHTIFEHCFIPIINTRNDLTERKVYCGFGAGNVTAYEILENVFHEGFAYWFAETLYDQKQFYQGMRYLGIRLITDFFHKLKKIAPDVNKMPQAINLIPAIANLCVPEYTKKIIKQE